MLFGFAGERFSGKDTAAKYFQDFHNFHHFKFAGKLKRAVEILFDLPDDWDWDKDKEIPCERFKGYTKRQVLQWYGTDGLPEELCDSSNLDKVDSIVQVLFDCEIPYHMHKVIEPYGVSQIHDAIVSGGFRDKVDNKFWLNIVIPKHIRSQKDWRFYNDIAISDTRFKNEVTDLIWADDPRNGFLVYIHNPNAKSVQTSHASESYQTWLKERADYHIQNDSTLYNLYMELESMYGKSLERQTKSTWHRKSDST